MDHHNYHDFAKILFSIEQLEKAYPENVQLTFMKWKTHEMRKVPIVKIFSHKGGSGTKKVLVIEAGIHAREWISPATALYLMEKLVKDYYHDKARKSRWLLDEFDWWIMPVVNPDGYQ